MNRYRGNAIAVGLLLIACTATSILSAVPLGSMLDHSDYLNQLAASDSRVIWTALIEFVWAATGAGIAIGLYPVIRRHNRALALGSVAGRVAEGVFVLIGTLSLLVLLTVSQESLAPGADAASFRATGDALLAVRDWTTGFLGMLPFLTAALLYYYVLYRARLIPRWLSGWGIVGAVLGLVATVYSGYTQEFGFSTVNTVLNLPIALQEMVLAVWLLAKGFNPSSVDGGADSIRSSDAGRLTGRVRQESTTGEVPQLEMSSAAVLVVGPRGASATASGQRSGCAAASRASQLRQAHLRSLLPCRTARMPKWTAVAAGSQKTRRRRIRGLRS